MSYIYTIWIIAYALNLYYCAKLLKSLSYPFFPLPLIKFKTLLYLIFCVPILEELFFRLSLIGFLKEYDIGQYHIVSSCIFGLCHIFGLNKNNRHIKFFQIISTSFLGYYLSLCDNLFLVIFLHMAYNFIGILFIHITYLCYHEQYISKSTYKHKSRIIYAFQICKYILFL